MKKVILKSIVSLTLGLCAATSTFALNASTVSIKNYTKDTIAIKVFDAKQIQVAGLNILKNEHTDKNNWVSSKWIWENDYFDSIDVFYKNSEGEDFYCGSIEAQPIAWGTTVNRSILIRQCDDRGFRSTTSDTVTMQAK